MRDRVGRVLLVLLSYSLVGIRLRLPPISMNRLLGMNCVSPTDFNFSFRGFKCRGGHTDIHSHGWGIAIYEGRGLRTFHDTLPCANSPLAEMVSSYPIKTLNMMAHIRYATRGEVCLENVHPFQREMWGIQWTFAHNGDVPKFTWKNKNPQDEEQDHLIRQNNSGFNNDTMPLLGRCSEAVYHPVGDTDSEAVFCAMLNALRAEFTTLPTLPVLYESIQRLCCEIIRGREEETIFNFLLGCGQFTMFAFSWPGARKGSDVWNGLHYLVRWPPFSKAKLKDVDYAVDFNEGVYDRVAIIATKPLTTNENWKEFKRGQLFMFDNGLPYSRPYECAAIERCGRGLSSRAIPRGKICPFKYQYNTPKLLRDAVCKALCKESQDDTHDVWSERALDLGCGSGLSGAQFRSCVNHLTGVDLSPEMADEARERGCYDRIVVGHAESVLLDENSTENYCNDQWYDFIFACDLFSYVGDLRPIFNAVKRSLKSEGGVFAFSVEVVNDTNQGTKQGDDGFVMQSCARFAHKQWYISTMIEEYGFHSFPTTEHTFLRQHDVKDVYGALFVLQLSSEK